MLGEWWEINDMLYESQMTFRRQRSSMEAMGRVFNQVHETCTKRKLAGMLLMNMKWAFDHISRSCQLHTLEGISIDRDLMWWTESIKSDRSMSLVINRDRYAEAGVETGVLQESPVSPVLLQIYLSGVFQEAEAEVDKRIATSFAYDCRWLMATHSVQ